MSRKFLTLVAISFLFSQVFVKQSWAVKQDPSPDYAEPKDVNESHEQQTGKELDYVDVAKPPPVAIRPPEVEYFYPFNRGLSARLAPVLDSEKYKDKGFLWLIGVSYLHRQSQNEYYDFGFDIRTDSVGTIFGERRWISGKAALRPYAKLGAGVNLVPSDQLATFLKLKNYEIRAAVGFEKIFLTPMSFRYEFELIQGEATEVLLSIGLYLGVVIYRYSNRYS